MVHPDASTDCPLFRENLSGRGIGTNIRYVALCVIAAVLLALTRLHRQEFVCIFGHSEVTLQWHFIIWMTSSQMGSPSYPEVDPDLCQRQLLEVISAGLTHVQYVSLGNYPGITKGRTFRTFTEGKSDQLKEYYQDRKQAKENSPVTQSGVLSFLIPPTHSALNLDVSELIPVNKLYS